jgi:hypothetical protein
MFLVGAARKVVSNLWKYREFKVQSNMYGMKSSWYCVKLMYVRVENSRIDSADVKLRHFIISGFFRRFRLRGASSTLDVLCEVRKSMDKYIRSHGGLVKGIDYSIAPMTAYVGGEVQYRGKNCLEEFSLIKEAFYGIPREL